MLSQVHHKAQALALTHAMGKLKREYKPHNKAIQLLVAGIILICFVAPLGTITFFGFHDGMNSNREELLLLASAGLMLIAGALLLRRVLRAYPIRYSRTFLYTDGLIVVQCNGDAIVHTEILLWKDVVTIWRHVPPVKPDDGQENSSSIRTPAYSIQCQDGHMFQHDPYIPGIEQIGPLAEQQTLPFMLPPALARYQQNQPVFFGPLSISTRNVAYHNQWLPWNEVKDIIIQNETGTITIKKHGQLTNWAIIPFQEIPNITLLNALLKKFYTPDEQVFTDQ